MTPSPTTRIDETAPALTRQERVVAAPADTVFRLLADVEAWPRWQTEAASASAPGPLATGTVFQWRSGVRITSTITVLVPPRAIAWTGRAIGTRAVHTWSLAPVEGGTLVRTEESMNGWLPRLMPGMVQRTLERGVTAVLDALETAVAR